MKLFSGQSALGLALLLLAGLAYRLGLPGEYAAGLGMLGTLLIKAEFRLGSPPESRGGDPAQRDKPGDQNETSRGGA